MDSFANTDDSLKTRGTEGEVTGRAVKDRQVMGVQGGYGVKMSKNKSKESHKKPYFQFNLTIILSHGC